MKKILVINTFLEGGGAARVSYDLFDFLNSKPGYRAYFAYGRGPRVNNPRAIKFGNLPEVLIHLFLVRFLGLEGFGCYFATRKLIKFIKRERIDLVHLGNLHGYYLNFFQLVDFLKKSKIPVVWSLYDEWLLTWLPAHSMGCKHCKTLKGKCKNDYGYPKSYFPVFAHYMLRKKTATFKKGWDPLIVCPAKWLLESLAKSPFKHLKAKVIFAGPDTTIFKPVRDKLGLRRQYSLPIDQKIIMFSARNLNDKNKGARYILQAADLLKDKNYLFLALGAGRIKTTDNFKTISYSINKAEIAQILALADIYCSTSAVETSIPLASLEAMACGLPIVAYDIAALREHITSRTGALVPYGDTDKLAKKLDLILSNDTRRKKMGANARTLVVKRFSQKNLFDEYLTAYDKMIS